MREKAGSVPHEGTVVEIVGTGGDEANTFNISTTSGFIISAAGIPVANMVTAVYLVNVVLLT